MSTQPSPGFILCLARAIQADKKVSFSEAWELAYRSVNG